LFEHNQRYEAYVAKMISKEDVCKELKLEAGDVEAERFVWAALKASCDG